LWRELIGARPTTESEPKAGEWLCVLGQAESNLSPYLNVWIQDDSLDANLNLARTLLTGAWTAQWNPFWGDRAEQIQQVDNWINGPAVRDKLRRAYEKWPNTPASEDLFNAAAMLQT
jgi:hypothetical protein